MEGGGKEGGLLGCVMGHLGMGYRTISSSGAQAAYPKTSLKAAFWPKVEGELGAGGG